MAKKVLNVVDVLYNQKKKLEIESSELPPSPITPESLVEVLEGSETIVVDVAEDGEHVEVHLDGDVINKIDNSLQTPQVAPLSTALVGIGTNKAQVNVGIGEGLQIVNNVLQSTGGGGTQLYRHMWTIEGINTLTYISTKSTADTVNFTTLQSLFKSGIIVIYFNSTNYVLSPVSLNIDTEYIYALWVNSSGTVEPKVISLSGGFDLVTPL